MPSVTIDERNVCGLKDETILELARRIRIDIPALCAEERLEPSDSCGICVVEVEEVGVIKSCSTTIKDGMVIHTNSKAAEEVRRTALELLLSNHWGDCIAPCQLACPAHTDCQGYVSLAGNGLFFEALQLLYEKLPFPASFGRICPAPCEDACRRQIADDPLQIRHIKRFLGDKKFDYVPKVGKDTGYRIAIVGGGPAGLSVAYFLRRNGHATVVFDAMPKMGGMLRYGIPDFRLPQEVLDREIKVLQRMGIELRNDVRLGEEVSLADLERDFDAVFLGLGAWGARSLAIPGKDHPAIFQGIDFLRMVSEGRRMPLPDHIAIIGGGNTAMDAARSALRLGTQVTVLYRRSREQMPALPREIVEVEDEGAVFQFLTQPVEFISNGSFLSGVKCVKMKLGAPDAQGRARPIQIDDSEFVVPVKAVILAVGQLVDTACLVQSAVDTDRRGRIIVNEETGQTSREKIFAGGDVVTGPGLAVEAVAAAYQAATAIERYLLKENTAPSLIYANEKIDVTEADLGDVPRDSRITTCVRPPAERIHDFSEYETNFTDEQAKEEGKRCLGCGCLAFDHCLLRDYATMAHASQDAYEGELSRKLPDNRHPFIIRDPGKCIACGRCVRVCGDICGIHAIDFVGRGITTEIQAPFDHPWQESNCVSCGACVDTCPTGTLEDRTVLEKQLPIQLMETNSTCCLCSLGCQIKVGNLNGNYMRTLPAKEGAILCAKGRYGWHKPVSEPRITHPLIRTREGLIKVSWDEAFNHIKESLTNEGSATTVIGAGHLTNEEAYLIARLAHEGLDTDLLTIEELSDERVRLPARAITSTDAIATADLILVLGPRSPYEGFVLDLKVRIAQRAGATVVSLQGRLDDADIVIDDRDPRSIIEQLTEPAENKTRDGLTSLRERIALAKHPLLVIEERMISQETARAILSLVTNKPSYKIALLRGLANLGGLMQLGFRAGNKSSSDQFSTCFVFGANPGKDPIYASKLEQANLVVAMTHMQNETTNYADVVLPMSLPIECQGHLTDSNNKTRALLSDLSSPIHKENWKIIVELGSMLGLSWRYGELQTVTEDTNSLLLSHFANESSASIFAGTVSSLALAIEHELSKAGI